MTKSHSGKLAYPPELERRSPTRRMNDLLNRTRDLQRQAQNLLEPLRHERDVLLEQRGQLNEPRADDQ